MKQLSRDPQVRFASSALDFFSDDVAAFKKSLTQLEQEISPGAIPQRGDSYHERMGAAIRESQRACRMFEENHPDERALVKEVQEGFRDETEPWFGQSWFANRARTKPSGFSGDYLMLLKLYEGSTPSRGIGAYIDLVLSELQLSNAVRARMDLARAFLIQEIESRTGDLRILDMACGPCREFQDWPDFAGRKIEVVAMDNDPAALHYVESQIAPSLPTSTTIEPVRYNALRTRNAAATIKAFGKFDIIYSVGLCDYLTDEHLIRILSGLDDTLNENGKLVIAFKDSDRYDKTPYQWHLDWFFYQRTVDDVLQLYERAGFDSDHLTLTRDTTGIITNYISKRPPGMQYRLDCAESKPVRKPRLPSPLVGKAGS